MAANLTGNSGWKKTSNPAIKQRLNWAVTTGSSASNSSTVIVSFWLKKDGSIQNEQTTSSDCRFKITCDGKTITNAQISNSMTINPNNTEQCVARYVFEGTDAIQHNEDGTKTVKITVSGGFGGTSVSYYDLKATKTLTLPAIDRASSIDIAEDSIIGSNASVTWTPHSSRFCYKLIFEYGDHRYEFGNSESPICPGSTDAYTYSDFTIPLELLNEIVDTTSGYMVAYLYTYTDSNYTSQLNGISFYRFKISIPINIVPTIDSFNYDVVPKVENMYVDGYVSTTFTITASGAYGSSIESLTVRCENNNSIIPRKYEFNTTDITDNGDGTYSCSLSTGYFDLWLLEDESTVFFLVYVTDSRGMDSTPQFCGYLAYPYSNPRINLFKVERNSVNTNVVDVWLNASASSIGITNTVKGIINYRKSGDTSWKSAGYIGTGIVSLNIEGESISPVDGSIFEDNYSYEIQAYVYDSIGNVAIAESYIGVVDVLVDFRAGGKGLGIGKMAESDSLEVALPSRFYDDVQFDDQTTFLGQASFSGATSFSEQVTLSNGAVINGQARFGSNIARVISGYTYQMSDMIDYGIYSVGNSMLESGFSLNDSSVPIYFSRVGNIVSVTGNIKVTTDITLNESKNGKTFFVLPDGFRPTHSNVYTLCQSSSKYTWVLDIDTSGNMKVSRYGKTDFEAISSGTSWFPFNVTFFVNDGTVHEYSGESISVGSLS